ncbi:MAG: hypothetical protein IJT30_10860 [Muribaculaceae bacterium]|nr:hypothetical protein [Muribaculaceae bacterium]
MEEDRRVCPNCGESIPASAGMCMFCCTRFGEASSVAHVEQLPTVPSSESVHTTVQAPVRQEPQATAVAYEETTADKPKRKTLLWSAAVIGLCAVAGIIYALSGPSLKKSSGDKLTVDNSLSPEQELALMRNRADMVTDSLKHEGCEVLGKLVDARCQAIYYMREGQEGDYSFPVLPFKRYGLKTCSDGIIQIPNSIDGHKISVRSVVMHQQYDDRLVLITSDKSGENVDLSHLSVLYFDMVEDAFHYLAAPASWRVNDYSIFIDDGSTFITVEYPLADIFCGANTPKSLSPAVAEQIGGSADDVTSDDASPSNSNDVGDAPLFSGTLKMTGKINPHIVAGTFRFTDDHFTGIYGYNGNKPNLTLKGRFTDDEKVVADEYTPNGNHSGHYEGRLVEENLITGTFTNSKGEMFYFRWEFE